MKNTFNWIILVHFSICTNVIYLFIFYIIIKLIMMSL